MWLSMTVMSDQERELQLCSRMLRSLAHRVRGDLSVITNDLAYMATLVNPSEVERARDRCSLIAVLMASFDALTEVEPKKEISLESLFRLFGISQEVQGAECAGQVKGSDVQLRQAQILMSELLGSWVARRQYAPEHRELIITLELNRSTDVVGAYRSISAFVGRELGERFVVEAGVIDLILRDHGWLVRVVSENNQTRCILTVPGIMI